MTWSEMKSQWELHLERVAELFPHTEPKAIARFRGNPALLAEYIADTHDVTISEAIFLIEDRLLPTGARQPLLWAAE